MTDLPDVLRGLPIHWQGVDDSTPTGCELVSIEVEGLAATYVVRAGVLLGRVEFAASSQIGYLGYAGPALKGGDYIGSGACADLATKFAEA